MGEIADIANPQSLSQAIIKVINQPSKYTSNIKAKKVAQHYNLNQTIKEYENLIKKLTH